LEKLAGVKEEFNMADAHNFPTKLQRQQEPTRHQRHTRGCLAWLLPFYPISFLLLCRIGNHCLSAHKE